MKDAVVVVAVYVTRGMGTRVGAIRSDTQWLPVYGWGHLGISMTSIQYQHHQTDQSPSSTCFLGRIVCRTSAYETGVVLNN
jgi:hypothetical protein